MTHNVQREVRACLLPRSQLPLCNYCVRYLAAFGQANLLAARQCHPTCIWRSERHAVRVEAARLCQVNADTHSINETEGSAHMGRPRQGERAAQVR